MYWVKFNLSLTSQVTGLEEGELYVFKVRAVNAEGIGKSSQPSEPVCAKALPGNDCCDCTQLVVDCQTSVTSSDINLTLSKRPHF